MKVKELDRTVNVAWSPAAQHPIMIAAGTAAQQLDSSFSTNAALEIYSLNLTEPGPDMELRSQTPSEHRFHKVVWGPYGGGGGGDVEHEAGIIVGGCDNGRIQMYSAAKLLAGEDGAIAQQDKHTGPVRALDFNPFQENLLATGAAESQIYIWDLKHTGTPMTPGAKSQPAEDVLSISWNRQVQHILASTFSQRCVVWDLRKNEPIIKLSDSNSRIRWKAVAWHPEVATQLCLASEEDQTPVIQLWDLRFATSPLKVMENHQSRGVLSIAWCAQDPDLLLSCGRDNRIICWNPNSDLPGGEVVCDVASTAQWNYDVSWCKRNPAIISCGGFDGHLGIYSMMGGQSQVQTSNKIADSFPGMDPYAQAPASQHQQVFVDLKKPPKWLRRPCGTTFGFGGKLVSFGVEPGATAGRVVHVSQVVTERELVAQSAQLEAALAGGAGAMAELCAARAAAARTAHCGDVWRCMHASFAVDPRTRLLDMFGFQQEQLNAKLSRLAKPANSRGDVDGLAGGFESLLNGVEDDETAELGADGPDGNFEASSAFDVIAATTKATPEKRPFKIPVGDDVDGLISQTLLLGNTEAAVELCLENNRMADAIILAMAGGADLLAKTQYRYLQQSQGSLASLIGAVVTDDWSQVVRSCQVDSWKEALAAALTHSKSDELPALCDQLGQRLEAEAPPSLALKAQLCYICAGSVDKLVDSWTAAGYPTKPAQLQELVELVMLLRKIAEFQGRSGDVSSKLADFLTRYSSLLASQGSLDAALSYLGNSEEEQISQLRDRLYRTLGHVPAYPQQQQQQPGSRAMPRTGRQSLTNNVYQDQRRQSASYGQSPAQTFPPAPVPAFTPAQAAAPYRSSSPGTIGGTAVTSRGKYVVDPSVKSSPYGSVPAPMTNPYAPAPYSQPAPFGQPAPYSQPAAPAPMPALFTPAAAPAPAQGGYNHAAQHAGYAQDAYANDSSRGSGSGTPQPPVALGNALPGWNDPPMVKNAARNQPKTDYVPQNPITHPLFAGAVQEQPLNHANMPGSYNGAQTYDHQGGQQYAPPSPQYAPPGQQYAPTSQQFAPTGQQFPQTQADLGYPSQPQQQQQQGYQHVQHQGYQPQQAAPAAPVAKVAEPPKPKAAIPEEHMYLQTVFDELQTRCSCAASNPQTRRKLEDVARKLEMLYDSLRDSKLSPSTLQGLHQVVQLVQIGDYTRGLELHTQLVSGPDFAQIASFMPGLKVLLQSALQLGVYLQ